MEVNLREQEGSLVRQCQSGDAAAWNEMVARHTRYVYGLCYRFTRRDCEARDLTQDVFIRVFRTFGSFHPDKQSFVAWLTVVTRNLLIDHYRRSRRDRLSVSLEDPSHRVRNIARATDRPDWLYAQRVAGRVLHSALLRIPAYLRETISLYEIHDLQYQEIARVQGIPIGTVKSRLKRGRTALARALRMHRVAA